MNTIMIDEAKYKNIVRFFNILSDNLFSTKGKLGYDRTLVALDRLCDEVMNTETDENVWYIGEHRNCTLDQLIVGGYWFFVDYHGGQDSPEYRMQCILGRVYTPNCAGHPEPETAEADVYEAFERLAPFAKAS